MWKVLILVKFVEFDGVVLMMRGRMVRIVHAEFGIRPTAQLAAEHEASPASDRIDTPAPADRASASRALRSGRHAGRLLHQGEAPAHSDLRPSGCAARYRGRRRHTRSIFARSREGRPCCSRADLTGDDVEHAAVVTNAGQARRRVRRSAIAEQPLEHRARIVLHRQRSRRILPRDGVGIRTTEADVTGTSPVAAVEAELERFQLRFLTELARGDLVCRHARLHVSGGRALDVHSRQVGGGAARVIAAAFTGLRERIVSCGRGPAGPPPPGPGPAAWSARGRRGWRRSWR